jgi:hypothetical protein
MMDAEMPLTWGLPVAMTISQIVSEPRRQRKGCTIIITIRRCCTFQNRGISVEKDNKQFTGLLAAHRPSAILSAAVQNEDPAAQLHHQKMGQQRQLRKQTVFW